MTQNSPLITVLMPIYNAQSYLTQALDSIRAQTCGDFELLAMDDGSTDASLQIIRDAAAGDSRIKPISLEHAGLVAVLNHGLSIAQGQFIARMDADDIADPERFEKQIAFLQANPTIHLLGTNYRLLINGTVQDRLTPMPQAAADVSLQLRRLCVVAHPTVMVRTSTIRQMQGYREHMLPAEDYDLWLRILSAYPDSIANLAQPLLSYRVHASQISSRRVHDQILCTLAAQLASEFRRQGKPDPFMESKPVTYDVVAGLVDDVNQLNRSIITEYCLRAISQMGQSGPATQCDTLKQAMLDFAEPLGLATYARARLALALARRPSTQPISKTRHWLCAGWHGVRSILFLKETLLQLAGVGNDKTAARKP